MASRDPFASLPDVTAYQPRPATERVLELLAEAVHLGDRPILLEGPAGMGKTLLLHVLAERLRGQHRSVAVPIPTLSPTELWHWVSASLGVAADFTDPPVAWVDSLRSGLPVLLLIDDANSLPTETVEALRAELDAHNDAQAPGLCAVLVASDDQEQSADFLAALGEPIYRVHFAEPMSAEECAAYVCRRLASADVDAATRARFDDAMLARLYAHSRGVPADVHEIADLLVRPDAAARAHELAAELRPDIVASAAARRSRESIERVAEWGDEDLAKTVGRRSKTRLAGTPAVEALKPFAPNAPIRRAKASPPRPAGVAPRSAALRIGNAAGAAALLAVVAGFAAWQLDLLGAPTPAPTHVTAFVEAVPATRLPDVAMSPPVEVVGTLEGVEGVEGEAPVAEPVGDRVVDAEIETATQIAALPEPVIPVAAAEEVEAAAVPAPIREASATLPSRVESVKPEAPPAPAAKLVVEEASLASAQKPVIAAVAGQRPPSDIAVGPGSAVIHLASVIAPAGTRIEIGDDVRGTAPLAAVLLTEGDHRVRWTRNDGSESERVFRVDADHLVLDLVAAVAADVPPGGSR